MSKEEAIIVLRNLMTDFSVCRKEREALDVAISVLEGEVETDLKEEKI